MISLVGTVLAVLGVLATILGLRHRARRAEADRDQARGERDVAQETAVVVARDAANKSAARADERAVEHAATEATAAGDPHPERAAARERATRAARAKR